MLLFLPWLYLLTPLLHILTHQQQRALENIVGKEEIGRNKQFLLFPQRFPTQSENCSPFVNILDIISLFAAELEKPKIGISGKGINLLPCNTDFDALKIYSCGKHCEKRRNRM